MNFSHPLLKHHIADLLPNEKPPVREFVDRSRVLVNTMLENPENTGQNFVLLLILADQLQVLHDSFEEEELRELNAEKNHE
jgi:hypothetical protein